MGDGSVRFISNNVDITTWHNLGSVRDGLPLGLLDATGRDALAGLRTDGLLDLHADRAVLTLRGRLLADAVVRALLP